MPYKLPKCPVKTRKLRAVNRPEEVSFQYGDKTVLMHARGDRDLKMEKPTNQ